MPPTSSTIYKNGVSPSTSPEFPYIPPDEEDLLLLEKNFRYPPIEDINYPWEEELLNITTSSMVDTETAEFQKIIILQKFASNILENLEDLNPKYAQLINKNFWDLL